VYIIQCHLLENQIIKLGGTRKRKLNAFMAAKEKARKANKPCFTYKGQKYNRKMTETGMAVYCK